MPEDKFLTSENAIFPNVNLQHWLIGDLISTMVYGLVLSLVLAYFHDFIKLQSRRRCLESDDESIGSQSQPQHNRHRIHFLIYTILMFSFSTLAFVGGTLATIRILLPSAGGLSKVQNAFFQFGEAIFMVLASWGADALMIWRCMVLYQTANKLKRSIITLILGILSLASLGTGFAYIVTALTVLNGSMIAFAISATLLNATLTILIVSRIWYHQKYIKTTLGAGHTSPYTRLIHLFVESASFIVVSNIVHVILTQWPNNMLIFPHQLLVHVYVISAVLIVYRVAYAPSTQDESDTTQAAVTTQLRFSHSLHSTAESETVEDEESDLSDPSRLKEV